jgi:wyosine [tRNA(Phe)-imidazoG37] synthetase (radical SAM superfamily)
MNLDKIHQGMETFKRGFQGVVVTETMLVSGINDDPAAIRRTAGLLRGIEPSTAYISVSTRPPAETWVRAPSEETLHGAYQQFREHLDRVELLIGYEGDEFTPLGEGIKVLLGIIAVHPMREDAVFSFLTRAGADRVELQELLDNKRIKKVKHGEHWFYLRRFHP